ncbi:DUF1203 domain-containing protein [Roseibium suaedae]|uniref:DUF1203 domain-containing protein n=1 Tax=Roseibium suaedae TaxID=735517 RepID=A0A1M7MA33_9HYPH|nr:DUF1203 domain-containing protein [Roseibium suaedae]SHM87655.1 Protein of unknown function [Roseibium suaedae]
MTFQVHPLPAAAFQGLEQLSTRELEDRDIQLHVSDGTFPCRVSLRDVPAGEQVFLLNYEHQPNRTPYRSRHAIFVARDAVETVPAADELPLMIRKRLLSVRAFNGRHEIVEAEVCEGEAAAALIAGMFASSEVDYIHLHFARRGCFAAMVTRS